MQIVVVPVLQDLVDLCNEGMVIVIVILVKCTLFLMRMNRAAQPYIHLGFAVPCPVVL